jgi:hypothetical protein
MSGVNVNYNAFGTPGFFEGTQWPISYQLTISFREIEYLLSNDWDGDATAERDVVTASVQTGEIIADTAKLVFKAGGDVIAGTFAAVKEFVLDEIPNQNDTDNLNNIRGAIAGLKVPTKSGEVSKVTFDVVGKGLEPSGKADVNLTAAGKYVLVFQQNPDTGKEFKAYEPVTKGTFDTVDDLNQYLSKEQIVGPVTFPPPPKAAAAAPG